MQNFNYFCVDKYALTEKDMKSEEIFYEPPMIDVIKVEVESGFAVSGYGSDSDDSEFGNYY